jgi:hypothetical protein
MRVRDNVIVEDEVEQEASKRWWQYNGGGAPVANLPRSTRTPL